MPGALLIVNADDYGLTRAVSEGILRAHREGVVTSTSVLALAPGFRPSMPGLRDAPMLGVGAHLAAVGEDPPLLSAREIPTLVDRHGRLPASWRHLLPRLLTRRVDPADIGREFSAQLAAIRAEGVTVDHLDTHQHLHLWPGVREIVLDLAVRAGVPAVRVTRSSARSVVGVTVRRLAAKLEAEARVDGLACPDAAAGLDEAGRLDAETAVRALDALAATGLPSVELSGHPGAREDPDRDRYRWGYRWGDELDALCAPVVRTAIDQHGFRLGTYAQIPRVAPDMKARVRGRRHDIAAMAAFRFLPRRERMHVRGRWASCPIPAVEAQVPRSGRVLEVGCGHGLVSIHLALTAPDRAVTGSDIDGRKIDLAQRAAENVPEPCRPRFVHRPDGDVPSGPWDAIVIVDVLYLLPAAGEEALLDACVAELAPGGVLVVKETDVQPRWKHRLATVQELVATRVLRITAGDTVTFTPIAELADALRARGLDVQQQRVDRGYLHPHALVVARSHP